MAEINLKKNIALSSLSKVLTILAAFVTNWFLARFLGPELRGKYVYLFTLNSIIWMFLDLGVHKSFPYLLQNQKVRLGGLYKLTLYTFFGGIAVIVALYFAAGGYIGKLANQDYPRWIWLALGLYIIVYQCYMRSQFLQLGSNQVRDYALMAFLPTFVFMVLIIPLFWLMPTVHRVEYSFLLNSLVLAVFLVFMLWKLQGTIGLKEHPDKSLVGQAYRLGIRAFISEYLITLLMRLDLIILKALGSYAQVGIYTLAVNFVDMINMACNTIGAVLLVKLTSLNDEVEALGIMRRILLLVAVIDAVAILIMVVFGRWFIVMLYGVAYVDAYKAFLLLIPAVFGITLGALFNTFIWSKGFPVISIIAPIGPLVLKLALNFLLVPRYGLFGTSVASSLCYVLWFAILLAWYFIRHPHMSLRLLIPLRSDVVEFRESLAKGALWLKNKLRQGQAA